MPNRYRNGVYLRISGLTLTKTRTVEFIYQGEEDEMPKLVGRVASGQTIQRNKIVALKNNRLYLADKDDEELYNPVGISMESGLEGDEIEVAVGGSVWTSTTTLPNGQLWLGNAGDVLASSPSSGIAVSLGFVIGNHEFAFSPKLPVDLNE